MVIIPEAFQVDSRMQSQWMPLTDVKALLRFKADAAKRLAGCAQTDNIETIDLHDTLNNKPGTYLNMDGHWSALGVKIVSDKMTEYINTLRRK